MQKKSVSSIKRFILFLILGLFLCLFSQASYARETYSKFLGGVDFANLETCLNKYGKSQCFDGDSEPSLDTSNGYLFQIIPIAFKSKITDKIQGAFEPTFFVGHRNFDSDIQFEEYNFKVDGDNTEYGVLGNLLIRLQTASGFVPYAGGGIGIKYTTFDTDISCEGQGERLCGDFIKHMDTRDDFVRVWTLIFGIEKQITSGIKGNIQYNYMGADASRHKWGFAKASVKQQGSHILSAGFTF